MNCPRACGRRNGFTLIELLVVVAIISLLVSVLLPSLSRARDLAKIALCMSQLDQWAKTHLLHAYEDNDRFRVAAHVDHKSPEIVAYSQYNLYFVDRLEIPKIMFYCPLRPEWYPEYWNLSEWGGTMKYFSMIGYTYLAHYNETAYPFFLDGYHSPADLNQSEGWWVLMTDVCRGYWNANHIMDDRLSNTVLCVDGRVEHQTGELTPYFDAYPATPYPGYRVLWSDTR